jgi:hypothetical protein
MARKRNEEYKKLAKHWNKVLAKKGLPVDRGLNRRVVYVGGSEEIERLAGFVDNDNGETPMESIE